MKEDSMDILDEIALEVVKGDASSVEGLTEKALSQGISAAEILNLSLIHI